MISVQEVEEQLKRIGASFKYWGRAEVNELHQVLFPGEQIQAVLNGRYEGGFALLCVTDQRILLVDKKPLYLTLEDIRYDMVSEVDYSYRLLESMILVRAPGNQLSFMSWRHKDMRALCAYIQQRVMELRQQQVWQAELHEFEEQAIREQPEAAEALSLGSVATASATPLPTQSIPFNRMRRPTLTIRGSGVQNPYTKTPFMTRRRISPWGR